MQGVILDLTMTLHTVVLTLKPMPSGSITVHPCKLRTFKSFICILNKWSANLCISIRLFCTTLVCVKTHLLFPISHPNLSIYFHMTHPFFDIICVLLSILIILLIGLQVSRFPCGFSYILHLITPSFFPN